MMREDRLVLPIPPGVHWTDPMPILLPEVQKALPDRSGETPKPQIKKTPTLMRPTRRGARFGPPSAGPEPEPVAVAKIKPAKPKREKVKADPKHVAAARELRDRYLEQFNAGKVQGGAACGEISRRGGAAAEVGEGTTRRGVVLPSVRRWTFDVGRSMFTLF